MKYWLQCGTNTSWNTLAGVLYYMEEHIALEKIMKYIHQPRGTDMSELWKTLFIV